MHAPEERDAVHERPVRRGEVAKVLEDYDADDTAALLMLALLKLQISGRPALSIGCSF